jgi:Zn-dependent peptidase ImmA (M78 family)
MHEMAHYILHREHLMKVGLNDVHGWAQFVNRVGKDTSVEKQANEFAGRFLVPPDRLQLLIQEERPRLLAQHDELPNELFIKYMRVRLAKRFNVSPSVIAIRMSKERLVY